MCHERWAKLRDEAVESQWLRDMQQRDRPGEQADDEESTPLEDSLTAREALFAAPPVER